MHSQYYNKIREKCIEANPIILDLVFGCEIYRKGATKREFFAGSFNDTMSIVRIDENGAWLPFEVPYPPNSQDFEILGREITLSDILYAIGKKENRPEIRYWNDEFQILRPKYFSESTVIPIPLDKPVKDWDESTLKAISEILE